MKKIIILLILISACTTAPVKIDYKLTGDEIRDIIKHDTNLTPVQKVILTHAVQALKNAEKESAENVTLEKKVIAESKLAGVGKFIYVIIGAMVIGIVAYVFLKFIKKIP